ncbi:MAG: channel protein TolC [Betaproteobacteria bacterium]|nr:channel protein TolC [Betaproteobacteria bacterium]NBT10285.1 channel protein TolC [Betaproteobacteria bacterium]NBX97154.1 channel protein TolC [Betaproteobacteria bacterium]
MPHLTLPRRWMALCVLCLASLPSVTWAQTLPLLLEAARGHDAAFLAARAQFDSAQFRMEQVRALRRPGLTADTTVGRSENSTPFSPSVTGSKSDTTTTNLNASQPLFNRANDLAVAQAEKALDVARADVESAEQDLIIRVSQAYFDVLGSRDALATVQASKAAITEQLASAKRNFEVGTATITDAREAQARYDLVIAQELAATNDLRNRQLVLEQVVGRLQVQPAPLRLPLVLPPLVPQSSDAWVEQALNRHPMARKARLGLEIAQLEVSRARAGHLPTVALTGRYTQQRVDGTATVRSAATNSSIQVGQLGTSTTSVVGVTLSVPLYAGRATDNRVSETLKLEEKARHDLDSARRGVELATRQSFMGLQSLAAQVKALEAAEASSQLALESTQLGYKVGVRVNLDVLNAQSLLFQTRRDLAKARYDSILASLRLRQAAGTLGNGDVQALAPLLGS